MSSEDDFKWRLEDVHKMEVYDQWTDKNNQSNYWTVRILINGSEDWEHMYISDNKKKAIQQHLDAQRTPNEQHIALQTQFMSLVTQMVNQNCPLPAEFALFYSVKIQADRLGQIASIKPHLTAEAASADLGEDEEWIGKYGSAVTYQLLDSNNRVFIENYRTPLERPRHYLDVSLDL